MKPRIKIKFYIVCKDCGEVYEQEPALHCEICGGKKFKKQEVKLESFSELGDYEYGE